MQTIIEPSVLQINAALLDLDERIRKIEATIALLMERIR